MTIRLRRLLLAAALAFAASGSAAATLSEADAPGGAFGASWDIPTVVDAGYDVIEGVGDQNRFDNFVFALPRGAQKVGFEFTAPKGAGNSYSAGGTILYSAEPFRWGWDGTKAASIQVDFGKPSQSFAFALAEGFGDKLYLALNFTHGADLAYRVSAPFNAKGTAPAPVPLPTGLLLMATAAAALGAVRVARRGSATGRSA